MSCVPAESSKMLIVLAHISLIELQRGDLVYRKRSESCVPVCWCRSESIIDGNYVTICSVAYNNYKKEGG